MSRTPITNAYVRCWSQTGDAYVENNFEDGPRVVNPPKRPCVLAETARGDQFVYAGPLFNTKIAEELAANVREKGSIDETKWTYLRGMYGTPAYFEDGWHDLDRSLD